MRHPTCIPVRTGRSAAVDRPRAPCVGGRFKKAWSRFDPKGTGFIPFWKLLPLCEQLARDGCSLGIAGQEGSQEFCRLRDAIAEAMLDEETQVAAGLQRPSRKTCKGRPHAMSGNRRVRYMLVISQLVVVRTLPRSLLHDAERDELAHCSASPRPPPSHARAPPTLVPSPSQAPFARARYMRDLARERIDAACAYQQS